MDKMERELPSFEAPERPGVARLVEAMLGGSPVSPQVSAMTQDPDWVASREDAETLLRAKDWANLGRYEGQNAALAASGVHADLVFMGDSITEFWPLADPSLFSPVRIGRGIAGQTTQQMLVRFQADVLAHRPRAVHLLAGANDIGGNTGPTTPYRYQCSMRAMVALAQAGGATVLLGLMTPCAVRLGRPDIAPASWVAELNAWLRTLAAETGCTLADYHTALDDGQGGLPAHCSQDGLHPNRRGYARMRSVLEPLLDQLGV